MIEEIINDEFVRDAEDMAGELERTVTDLLQSLLSEDSNIIFHYRRLQRLLFKKISEEYPDIPRDIHDVVIDRVVETEKLRQGIVN